MVRMGGRRGSSRVYILGIKGQMFFYSTLSRWTFNVLVNGYSGEG